MIKDLEMGRLSWIFLGGTNIILNVLIKWGYGNQSVVSDVMMAARMWNEMKWGLWAKYCRQPLQARKQILPLEPPEETSTASMVIVA